MGKSNQPKNSQNNYMDKYGAVDTAAWQAHINTLQDRTWTETVEDSRRGGTKQVTRRDPVRTRAQQEFNQWNEANKYKQQTLNQHIMSGASKNENLAATSTNELDTAQTDNVDPAVTSVGKKKKTQGSLSTSLGI